MKVSEKAFQARCKGRQVGLGLQENSQTGAQRVAAGVHRGISRERHRGPALYSQCDGKSGAGSEVGKRPDLIYFF